VNLILRRIRGIFRISRILTGVAMDQHSYRSTLNTILTGIT
jgi:hypothetical protein